MMSSNMGCLVGQREQRGSHQLGLPLTMVTQANTGRTKDERRTNRDVWSMVE